MFAHTDTMKLFSLKFSTNRNNKIWTDIMPQIRVQVCKYMVLKRLVGVALLVACTAPVMVPRAAAQDAPVSFAEARAIMVVRCVVCHSESPTQAGFITPPNGVAFDTPEQIKAKAAAIEVWAIQTGLMPLDDMTKMTDDERATLGRWLPASSVMA